MGKSTSWHTSGRSWPRWEIVVAALTLQAACTDAPTGANQSYRTGASRSEEAGPLAATWTVTNLGVLQGGTWSEAYGISDNGWVVGVGDWVDASSPCSAETAAFLRKGSQTINLHQHTPGCLAYDETAAFDVNDSGTAVGYSRFVGDRMAVTWDASGNYREIAFGCPSAAAFGINNAGTVAGWYVECNGLVVHPFIWTASGGQVDALPAGYNGGFAVDVTDSGVIIGVLDGQGAMWTLGGPVTIVPAGVGTVGTIGFATYSIGGASAGSATGIVGGDARQGWKYVGSFSTLPPFTPGAAADASAKRRAVGWRTQPDVRAVTVSPTTGVTLLPGLAPSNAAYAAAVNTCGSIAGYAPNAAGRNRAVVWRITPCDP